jgi:RNA-directed DNA polymerase
MRIAKAWKEGKLRTVKTLQRLLLRSFYAKLLAVKRVTSNKGSKTPGVDKVLWRTPEDKLKAAIQLGKGKHTPLPLRRMYILKKNGKKRPLGIPTIPDRAVQALHLLTLEPIAESSADGNSYGFRSCRSTADAIEQCFNTLSRKVAAQYILEGDIKACFDEISHEWILNNIPMDEITLRKMLKSGYMEDNVFHATETGTPQGGLCEASHNPPYAKEVIMRRKSLTVRVKPLCVILLRIMPERSNRLQITLLSKQ